MADITLRILGQEPLPLNLGSDNSETLSVGSGVTEGRLQEVLTDYVPKSDIDTTLSISGDVAESKTVGDLLMALFPTDSASGAIASFSDGADNVPVKSLSVGVEPVQNLNGQNAPYPPGGGKNKIAFSDFDFTVGNVRFYTSNGNLYFNGTSTSEISAGNENFKTYMSFTLPAGSYYFNRGTYPNATYFYHEVGGVRETLATNKGAFTLSQAETVWIGFYIYNKSFSTELVPVQIEVGSSPTSYSPYSNICPISGWNETNVVRCGKNLIKNILYQASSSVVDLGQNDNTSFGTPLKAGEYTISYSNSGQNPSIYIREENDSGNTSLGTVTQKTFTIDKSGNYRIWLYRSAGVSASDISNVQLEVGSTKTDYAPYTGETYTIPYSSTIYGGTLDVTNGTLVVDRAMVDLGTLTWNSTNTAIAGKNRFYANIQDAVASDTAHSNSLCSQYSLLVVGGTYPATDNGYTIAETGAIPMSILVYDSQYASSIATAFKTAMNGVQLCYTLATPITLSLTPTEIKTLLGDNNIYADSGDVAVVYSADIAKYIDKRIGA